MAALLELVRSTPGGPPPPLRHAPAAVRLDLGPRGAPSAGRRAEWGARGGEAQAVAGKQQRGHRRAEGRPPNLAAGPRVNPSENRWGNLLKTPRTCNEKVHPASLWPLPTAQQRSSDRRMRYFGRTSMDSAKEQVLEIRYFPGVSVLTLLDMLYRCCSKCRGRKRQTC
jgi:hypothetical protein